MTEEQIEREVERTMDRLDRQFMNGAITEQQYSEAVRKLSTWADHEYFIRSHITA